MGPKCRNLVIDKWLYSRGVSEKMTILSNKSLVPLNNRSTSNDELSGTVRKKTFAHSSVERERHALCASCFGFELIMAGIKNDTV